MSGRERDDTGAWEKLLFDRLQIFVRNWQDYEGTEQSGAQSFLQKLLEIYEVEVRPGSVFEQHPVRVPAKGKGGQASLFSAGHVVHYATERMDMYLPRVCVWEMKPPKEKDLQAHHAQILGYWARVQTRYMVLSNFRELWIYDTEEEGGQLVPKLKLLLEDLPSRAHVLNFLRGEEPDLAARAERVTVEAARLMGRLVREVVAASPNPAVDRERVTKLMLECVFAMFAEDTELMPKGLFSDVLRRADEEGELGPVWSLFDDFGRPEQADRVHRFAPYVNGPLFDRNHPRLALSPAQIHDLHCAARDFEWHAVRPEIFGSIFEQALDAVERHELGAHFTREADIARVVGPTVIEPWRTRIANLRTPQEAEQAVEALKAFHVLDPACGCGNFLYVVYREMKRLESALFVKWSVLQRKVAKRRADMRPPPPGPWFTIHQLHGIEINEFAAFLARVVLWIGEHLAKRELGLDEETLPLKSLEKNVRRADALLSEWPRPAGELAIVGNPPYLGVRKLRRELGDAYVDTLFEKFPDNRAADYVTYWFPKALEVLRPGERAGFVCTNSIAQNESREASLDRVVAAGGTLTSAWKSYPWPGDAAVHVSIVNWVMASFDGIRTLDGREVPSITPALGDALDMTTARPIRANERLCFMGVTPGNKEFVLTDEQRQEIVAEDPKSAEVIFPFLVGKDVNREVDQQPTRYVIDFGMRTKEEAEAYRGAMRHVRKHVYPVRSKNRRETYAKFWWRFVEPRSGMRQAISGLKRVIVVPCVSPRMIALRAPTTTCFDHQLMVIALSDAYSLGILQSRLHALWARARGSTLKGDLRYTNTTIFETYPFPRASKGRYDPRDIPSTPAARSLSAAAERFERERAQACREKQLGLTKIHNLLEQGKLPDLAAAYAALNDAVTACYGFPAGAWRDDAQVLRLLLDLNHELSARH